MNLRHYLEAPVSIAPLAMLRVLFGLLMLGSTLRFVALGWVDAHLVEPVMHFKYFGFHWVEPLGRLGLYAVHGLMMLAALGVMLGAWYRLSAVVLFLSFTYCELIDLTYYLNHYYFLSLVSLLLIFMPAQRAWSFDTWRRPERYRSEVPRWTVGLFRLQIALVYVFAGLAKLNPDWLLEALPLKIWLPAHDDLPLLGWAFRYEFTAYLFSWSGMLYDTFIPLLLLWPPTRWLAYAAVVFFHLMTGLLFQIGVFPLAMILLTWIFFPANWHARLLDRISPKWGIRTHGLQIRARDGAREKAGWQIRAREDNYRFPRWSRRWLLPVVGAYVMFQLLFPWRYLLYDGNLFWNEEGYRFSWRVMLVEKAGTATFYVRDGVTGREGVVDNREFLNAHQEKQMSFQPDMLLQFAHFLADHYEKQGVQQPQVRAEVYVTMNARPSRLLIDPEVDLVKEKDGWRQKEWVYSEVATSDRR